MRTFIILIIGILLSGCCTQKRCLTKYPPETIIERSDSIVFRDTIIYKDRVIRDTIQADTVFREKTIKIPESVIILPVEAENKYARAKSWIENRKLKLQLETKSQVIERIIKNAEKQEKYWMDRYIKEKAKESYVVYRPKLIHKIAMWFSLSVILAFAIAIYFRFKR